MSLAGHFLGSSCPKSTQIPVVVRVFRFAVAYLMPLLLIQATLANNTANHDWNLEGFESKIDPKMSLAGHFLGSSCPKRPQILVVIRVFCFGVAC